MKRLLLALSVLATPALAQPAPDNTALATGALEPGIASVRLRKS